MRDTSKKGTFTILNNLLFFTSFTTVIPASTASWCKACIGSVQYDAVTMSVFKAMHLLLNSKRQDIIIGFTIIFNQKITYHWYVLENISYHYLCAIFGCNGQGNKETTIWCDFIKSSRCSGLLSTSKSTGSVRSNLNKSKLSFEICIQW